MFFVFFFGIVALIAAVWWVRWSRVRALPTLDEYLAKYPAATAERGGVRCHRCRAQNIHLWWLFGPGAGTGPKKHICRSCGTDLYRS